MTLHEFTAEDTAALLDELDRRFRRQGSQPPYSSWEVRLSLRPTSVTGG